MVLDVVVDLNRPVVAEAIDVVFVVIPFRLIKTPNYILVLAKIVDPALVLASVRLEVR
jgi:hypothetical protein